ncbi:hypothetical protein BDN72DRAFT_675785 [Pluteus cervinus]|uniref:Uncharacterized protein n=1 Tax=Pluteus cervinus TaxID=181527 RepID=A0ACD3ASG3_9AGAR|nr:hypothetical protein BDN72DRAFT_675785 [Pluteus cervinus]
MTVPPTSIRSTDVGDKTEETLETGQQKDPQDCARRPNRLVAPPLDITRPLVHCNLFEPYVDAGTDGLDTHHQTFSLFQ